MSLLRSLRLGLLHRRTLRALERIEAHLAVQNQFLARLADHFVPEHPTEAAAGVGVDFLNEREAITVLDYVERTRRDTGRDPTEEEVLRYLADNATSDLQQTLEAR